MTRLLFREDPYRRDAPGRVAGHTDEGGIVLDASLFYPTGGGQPGDSGWLRWDNMSLPIATAIKGHDDEVILVPSEPAPMPAPGTHLVQEIDWERRHRHMRVHTALHILSAVMPYGVTGGQIATGHGRLDFDMPDAPDNREELTQVLNEIVAQDARVSDFWITAEELAARPDLIRTMAVKPPRNAREIRLVAIGEPQDPIDLQPCGGTHVARTGEIGALRLGRIEKKGRMNRRIYLHLDG